MSSRLTVTMEHLQSTRKRGSRAGRHAERPSEIRSGRKNVLLVKCAEIAARKAVRHYKRAARMCHA